jgi:hypothetical protein
MKNTLAKLVLPLAKPILAKIHRYKDVHRGESCYLIGGGVSLKWFDLAAFADKIAIPCGYLPFHNDFNKLQAMYLVIVEPWCFSPIIRTANPAKIIIKEPIMRAYRGIIKKYPGKEFFLHLSNYPFLRARNVKYLFRDINDDRLPADFITRRINAFEGSLTTSILLAIYMGFDHCYLVGYDYTHVPSRNLHFFEKGYGVLTAHPDYQKEFFAIAKEFIDITTITLDGTSDFVNSISYQKHTGRDPVFRENKELIDERYLKALATWPGYAIY